LGRSTHSEQPCTGRTLHQDASFHTNWLNAALYGTDIRIYDDPREGVPIGPKPLRNGAITIVLAMIAAGAWAWWREENADDVRDRNAPTRALNASLLGTVPIFAEVGAEGPMPAISEPQSAAAESYHFVVSSLKLALDRIDGTAVAITSVGQDDGKTVTALNVAIAASGTDHSPLLIDTDQRTRTLSGLVGLANSRGLTNLTGDNGDISEVVQSLIVDQTIDLNFVPAGTAPEGEAVRFFRSPAFTRAMPKIIDGSSLSSSTPHRFSLPPKPWTSSVRQAACARARVYANSLTPRSVLQ
jgi:hypothetical protein